MNVKIIIEGGEDLLNADMEAYYEMQDKIKALVKETFPKVGCSTETWGSGYYRGAAIRRAFADALIDKKFINKIAAIVRDLPAEA